MAESRGTLTWTVCLHIVMYRRFMTGLEAEELKRIAAWFEYVTFVVEDVTLEENNACEMGKLNTRHPTSLPLKQAITRTFAVAFLAGCLLHATES